MGSTVLQVVLGAVVAILVTIFIENLRRPRLKLIIPPPTDVEYRDRPARHVRFVSVQLINQPLRRWARWMSRNTALQCHAEISFHHLDGQNKFGRTMTGRWDGTPEPVPTVVMIGDTQFSIFSSHLGQTGRIDIPPGEGGQFAVAAKFDSENECYGWSNESYFSDPVWRNPQWGLPSGRYLVRVSVMAAGERCEATFRLINDVARTDFRVEKALSSDIARA